MLYGESERSRLIASAVEGSMLSVHQVADYLLVRASEQGRPLDHVKVQRLCYFVQGFYLAFRDQPLFGEPLRAWDDGPVTRELSDRFGNVSGPVPVPDDFNAGSLTPEHREFLDMVVYRFGDHPSTELARMTRADDPWRDAYNRSKHGRGDIITHESLADWFRPWLHELDTREAPPPPSDELVERALASERALTTARAAS